MAKKVKLPGIPAKQAIINKRVLHLHNALNIALWTHKIQPAVAFRA